MSLFVRKDLASLLAEAGAVGLTIYFSYGRFRAASVRDQAIADAA